jgi:L-ornithine N5-oxygenase
MMPAAETASVIGIGYGPAGIALAAALTEQATEEDSQITEEFARRSLFFERAPNSAWQPGMVLPGTDIQHHFLRDFGTPRDPASRFGFVRYIHDRDRFYPFTLRGGYVSRAEWSDYCEWAAARTMARIHYNHEVTSVEPVLDEDGMLVAFQVTAKDLRTGASRTAVSRRLVLATGHEPYIPDQFRSAVGRRVFHSTRFSQAFSALEPTRSVVVIGAGQNAGEVLLHLYNSTNLQLHSVVRNSGFRLYDLGHFANQAYWPAETDYFHALPPSARTQIFEEQYRTNYAAVDPDVSTGLYNAWYDGEVSGRQRLDMIRRTRVVSLTDEGEQVRVVLQERYTGELRELMTDAVILCTGFREPAVPPVLAPLAEHLTVELDGRLAVERDFRTPLCRAGDVALYLNGMSESRHGIASATSFSLIAQRAGEIARTLPETTASEILEGVST